MLFRDAQGFGRSKAELCGDSQAGSCRASLNVVALSRLGTAGRERGNRVWTAKSYAVSASDLPAAAPRSLYRFTGS
jgi:hypothetical protein